MRAENQNVCLLRLSEVLGRVCLSRSVVYAKMAAGTFPRPVYASRKAPRWRSDKIDRWIDELSEDRAVA